MRHRATCGLSREYACSGYNAWRDPLRPSQILAKLCRDHGLEGPVYAPRSVKVAATTFAAPPPAESPSSSPAAIIKEVDSETLALLALHRWAEVPKAGAPLVPEHVSLNPFTWRLRLDRMGA